MDNPNLISTLVLAYLGDAIYEVHVREHLLHKFPNSKVNDLHKQAIKYVKASSQANILMNIKDELTEKEERIVKRARNQKSNSVPKNADPIDYKHATAFEALIGYLNYVDKEKMSKIINKAINIVENEK